MAGDAKDKRASTWHQVMRALKSVLSKIGLCLGAKKCMYETIITPKMLYI